MSIDFGSWLGRLIRNCIYVLRHGHSHGRVAFLRTYMKVEIKRVFLRVIKRPISRERLFGVQMEFFHYETFATLFEEIYVGEMYWFASPTRAPLILDCGANIGMAVLYLKTLYPEAQILAFEADPLTFRVLQRNIEANGWHDVRAFNVALSGENGTATIYTDHLAGGLSHSIKPSAAVGVAGCTVETRRLSEFLDGTAHLLKMDVEGAEDEIIDDLARTGRLGHVEQMIAEYHLHLDPEEDRLGRFLLRVEEAGLGYQIRAPLRLPFRARQFQSMILYAYRKGATGTSM